MNTVIILCICIGILILALSVFAFNRMILLRNKVKRAWKDIEVQLKLRHNIVPLLVQTAEGYSLHEQKILETTAVMRAQAMAASGAGAKGDKELLLAGALEQLLALGEKYPTLKADATFRRLSDELVAVEDHLAAARKYYNGSVRIYDTYLQSFPQLILARPLRFRPAEYYQADRVSGLQTL